MHPQQSTATPLLRFSIVTPSFNQAAFLEQTIRSVLTQNYPRVEYIVMDGGSTDGSVDIIRGHADQLAFWTSAPDAGQPDAINRGFNRASGDILAFINSDDWYPPGTFAAVANIFSENPDCNWVCGGVENHYPSGIVRNFHPRAMTLTECLGRNNYGFHQPGMFWRRHLWESVGPFDASLQFVFDHDFSARALQNGFQPVLTDKILACFRFHPAGKSVGRHLLFAAEEHRVINKFIDVIPPADYRRVMREIRTYEADTLISDTYNILQAHGRRTALTCLLGNFRILGHVRPQRLAAGALLRILFTGKPPAWHLQKVQQLGL